MKLMQFFTRAQVRCAFGGNVLWYSEQHAFSFLAATQLLPPCQVSSFTSTIQSCCHHSLAKGALFSPTVSILEAQRCQAACPRHTACEKHSRISPSVTPSPVLPHCSPPAPVPPKAPPAKAKNEIFLFLRHIWNGGQTSSYVSTGQEVLPLSPAAVSYISHSEGT
uniref:Uncharacterized protein n=1 Tax=Myotis myotis TaxID=51298 RepID=A0A7J7VI36_MYOMY|nr:hypothetical protein mMyoMyo1_008331 [Myotis myotis]